MSLDTLEGKRNLTSPTLPPRAEPNGAELATGNFSCKVKGEWLANAWLPQQCGMLHEKPVSLP